MTWGAGCWATCGDCPRASPLESARTARTTADRVDENILRDMLLRLNHLPRHPDWQPAAWSEHSFGLSEAEALILRARKGVRLLTTRRNWSSTPWQDGWTKGGSSCETQSC